MKLIKEERGLYPNGLRLFLENNNHYIEHDGYKVIVETMKSRPWNTFRVRIYEYEKRHK